MKNRKIVLGLGLLMSVLLQAQYSAQYLHLNVGGGMHELSYKIPNGTQKSAAGFTLNTAYSYFFAPNWGLQTGIGIQSFGASSLINLKTEMPDTDSEADTYILNTFYRNWQEHQRTIWLDIPLVVQIRYPISQKIRLLSSVGAKVSMPVSATFKTKGGEIQTTGNYPQWHLELTDIPAEGYTTTTQQYSGKLSLKPVLMGIIDIGMLYKLSEKMDLYVGGYANYGLNSAITPDTKYIYQKDGVYNGLFVSEQVNDVKPISVGLKIGLCWQLPKKQAVANVEKLAKPIVAFIDERPKDTIVIQEVKPIIVEVIKDTIVQIRSMKPAEVSIQIPADTVPIPKIAQKELVQKVDSFEIIKKLVESTDFHFGLNSTLPTAMEIDIMKIASSYLKSNPNVELYVVGHTCNIGSHASNYQIGLNRAIMVKRAFVKLGSPAAQVLTISKSYDMPLMPNTTDENRILNRRAQLKLVRK
jgi:OmpA-OmpF porin, OOP family